MIDHQRYRNAADRLSAELPFPNTLGTFGWPVFQSLDAHRHRRDVTGAASAPLCTDTPRKASALCPATRKNSEIMKPSRTARVAMPVRSRGDRFLASAMKIGSTPDGSTTTSRVANAVRPNFSSASSISDKMGRTVPCRHSSSVCARSLRA